MNKNFDKKNIIIGLLTIIVIGLGIYSITNTFSVPPNTQGINANKDYEFYKHLTSYASLLPDEKLEIFNKRMEKVSESMEQEDSDLTKAVVLIYANEINKDKQTEQILLELKNTIASLVRDSTIDENIMFSKNTECAKLSSNIKEELGRKYTKSGFATESEELKFIFYSPTQNICMYTTSYSYSYSNYTLGKSEYYTKDSYRIYNVSSNAQIGDYPYYYYDYPSLSKDEADKAIKKGKRNYAKFILENSGYNAKLLESDL